MQEKEARREISMDEIPEVQGSGAGAAGAGEQVACPKCGRLFNWIDLGWHVAACANNYPRPKSGKAYPEIPWDELEKVRGGNGSQAAADLGVKPSEAAMKCPVCNQVCTSFLELKHHLEQAHGWKTTNTGAV